MRSSIALVLTVALISGCSTFTKTDPFTRESEINSTTLGSIACGSAGALIGGLVGGDMVGALIGGASGAVLCGGIGYHLDRQEKALRQQLELTGVRVVREGDRIRLVMPGHILFKTNQSRIHESIYPVLDSIREVLNEYDESRIVVQGHTDNTGSDVLNQDLSKNRANSVAEYLVYQGVSPNRILVLGYGETKPIADNGSVFGRSQNRRVELVIQQPND